MPKRYREIAHHAPVRLPPLSTAVPGRDYSFLSFLAEWVVSARGLRRDEYLEHLFEWEEALSAHIDRLREKAGGIVEPETPASEVAKLGERATEQERTAAAEADAESLKSYLAAIEEYHGKMSAAAIGESFFVSDEAFRAGKEACKQSLDKAAEPDVQGRRGLHPLYEPKILRHYHALCQSPLVDEKDVPHGKLAGQEQAPVNGGTARA